LSDGQDKKDTGVSPEAEVNDPVPAPADAVVEGKSDPTEAPATPTTDQTGKQKPDGPTRRKPRYPSLVRAFRAGRPIEGKITEVIKGGYEVQVGKARAFCPHSQIELCREDEPERQVGKTYQFKITQVRRGGEDVVLSRRAILEEARSEEAKAVRATLIQDAVMQGQVVGTADFGAFVDLGAGVLGLAHISEVSHKRIRSVDEAVKVGDTVRVRILKLKDTGRISLSIRRAEDDPWADIESKFVVGQVYPGTVQRLADFGAFVELAPGVEALAPASEFPPAAEGWKAGLEVGAAREWHVLSVDAKGRRASVTLSGEGGTTEPLAEGAELVGQVQRIERYGVFLWLGPGRVGLMPRAMSGVSVGTDLGRSFRIGDRVEVSILEIEDGGRRIRLCKKGIEAQVEKEATPAPRREERQAKKEEEPPASFGTNLGDKLRAALGQTDQES
jgi:small subunit ribosomal protein S1